MLVALGGKLAGYDGTFDFASGGDYGDKVNYVPMRMFVAAFGAMIVPLAYLTAIQLRWRRSTAILVGAMTLFGRRAFIIDSCGREWIHRDHQIDIVGFHVVRLYGGHLLGLFLVQESKSSSVQLQVEVFAIADRSGHRMRLQRQMGGFLRDRLGRLPNH